MTNQDEIKLILRVSKQVSQRMRGPVMEPEDVQQQAALAICEFLAKDDRRGGGIFYTVAFRKVAQTLTSMRSSRMRAHKWGIERSTVTYIDTNMLDLKRVLEEDPTKAQGLSEDWDEDRRLCVVCKESKPFTLKYWYDKKPGSCRKCYNAAARIKYQQKKKRATASA